MIVQCIQCKTKFRIDPKFVQQRQLRFRCTNCGCVFSVAADGITKPEATLSAKTTNLLGSVITFCNQKGGVAKTTSCLSVAMALAKLGKRVLCVDFDPQANLSLLANCASNTGSFYDAITGNKGLTEYIQHTQLGLWLLPSNSRMNAFPKYALQTKDSEQILHKTLEPLRKQFDFILIDTPPSLKFFTLNAIIASDCIVIPTQCAYLSMHGVEQIDLIINAIRKRTGKPKQPKLLFTLFDTNSKASQAIYGLLAQRYTGRILPHIVPLDDAVQEAQILQRPLFEYAPHSQATQAYIEVAKALVGECLQ